MRLHHLNCIASRPPAGRFIDGKRSYELTDQEVPEQFAGRKVRITGRLEANGKLHPTAIKVTK